MQRQQKEWWEQGLLRLEQEELRGEQQQRRLSKGIGGEEQEEAPEGTGTPEP
jgi:hypothetical protein